MRIYDILQDDSNLLFYYRFYPLNSWIWKNVSKTLGELNPPTAGTLPGSLKLKNRSILHPSDKPPIKTMWIYCSRIRQKGFSMIPDSKCSIKLWRSWQLCPWYSKRPKLTRLTEKRSETFLLVLISIYPSNAYFLQTNQFWKRYI